MTEEEIYYEYDNCRIKYLLTKDKIAVVGTNKSSSSFNAIDAATKCSKITIPKYFENTKNEKFTVTEIGVHAFYKYDTLETISLPETLLQINQGAFDLAYATFNLELPQGITFIGSYAFATNNVEYIKIGKNVRIISSAAFAFSRKACKIEVDKDNKYFCADENNVLFDKSMNRLIQAPTSLTSYKIPNSVRLIDTGAFAFSVIQEIVVPESVEKLNNRAFGYMNYLEKVIIYGNIKVETNIFLNDKAIKDVYYCGARFVDGNHFYYPENVTVHTCYGYKKEKFMNVTVTQSNECIAYPIKRKNTCIINRSCDSRFNSIIVFLIYGSI